MPRLVPKESLIRVLNLAKNPVQVAIQDKDLFQQPVESFQVSIYLGLKGLTCLSLKKGWAFFQKFSNKAHRCKSLFCSIALEVHANSFTNEA